MKKSAFKIVLKNKIQKFGYWSNEVKLFNDKIQSVVSYHVWLKWHNEAKSELNSINK